MTKDRKVLFEKTVDGFRSDETPYIIKVFNNKFDTSSFYFSKNEIVSLHEQITKFLQEEK